MQTKVDGSLVWYKPDDLAHGVFTLKPDGTIEVHKLGSAKMLAKLFWEAVHIHGMSYRQELSVQSQIIKTLMNDPHRDIIQGGAYEVYSQLKKEGKRVSMPDVARVLRAAETVANKQTN